MSAKKAPPAAKQGEHKRNITDASQSNKVSLSEAQMVQCPICKKVWNAGKDFVPDTMPIKCPSCPEAPQGVDARRAWIEFHSEFYDLKSGNRVLFREARAVNPALDLANGVMILTKLLQGQFKTYDRKTGDFIGMVDDLRNFVITSEGEMFECTVGQFRERDLFAKIPDSEVECPWSAASVRRFIDGDAHVDPAVLFQKTRDAFDYFMDFGEVKGASTFCALYNLLTYFFVLFDAVPYLKLSGMKGAAKTKLCELFFQMGFNPLMAVALTSAILYRTIQDTRGVMIIDEGESLRFNDDQRADTIAVLNSGWRANGSVSRMNMEGGRKRREHFSTFGPKIIGGINAVIDTLIDRAYELLLLKTLNPEKANRSVKIGDKNLSAIRDDHYILLMKHWKEVRHILETIENKDGMLGREWDKAKPLLVLAEFVDGYMPEGKKTVRRELIEFVREQTKDRQEDTSDSFEALILEELESMVLAEVRHITGEEQPGRRVEIVLKVLAEAVAIAEGNDTERKNFNLLRYSRKVSFRLKSMGLIVNKRVSHGITKFDTTLERTRMARERFFNSYSTSSPSSTLSTPSTQNIEKKVEMGEEVEMGEQKEKGEEEKIVARLSLSEVKLLFVHSGVKCGVFERDGKHAVSTIPTYILEKSNPDLIEQLRAGGWRDQEKFDRSGSFWTQEAET